MAGRDRPLRGATASAAGDPALAVLGVRCGEPVRWLPAGGGRWQTGTITRRERDGSIGVVDDRGSTRSLAVERVHVARRGPRGGTGWEPLTVRAGRAEQLCMLDDVFVADRTWRPHGR